MNKRVRVLTEEVALERNRTDDLDDTISLRMIACRRIGNALADRANVLHLTGFAQTGDARRHDRLDAVLGPSGSSSHSGHDECVRVRGG